MRSPKFQYQIKKLNAIFAERKLRDYWKGRVRKHLTRQPFLDLIDHRDFDSDIRFKVARLRGKIADATYAPSAPKVYLVEKSKGLCRQMLSISPEDLLVLEVLSRVVFHQIKKQAPSRNAFFEPDTGDFRKRLSNLESDYGAFASWKKFQLQVFQFARESRYVITADVANFYDFINFTHLRNIVAGLGTVSEGYLDLLIFTLRKLSWTPDYMPDVGIGLPQIESTAPRVLAHSMLFEVDRLVVDRSGVNYARFMDDMDFGAESVAVAKSIVRDVDLTLQARGLRLNSSKTRIMTAKDAFSHFCIRENSKLSILERRLEKTTSIVARRALASHLRARYEMWWRPGHGRTPDRDNARFFSGNGNKILKWTWRLLIEAGSSIPDEDLIWCIKKEPALRSIAFQHLSRSGDAENAISKILHYILRGNFVDDESLLSFARFVANSSIAPSVAVTKNLQLVNRVFLRNINVGWMASAIVALKMFPLDELFSVAQQGADCARTDDWAARVLAGLYPRFARSPYEVKYIDLVRSIENAQAESVLNHNMKLAMEKAYAKRHEYYLSRPNGSLPLGISFPKALQILCLKGNAAFSAEYAKIVAGHPVLTSDPVFKTWGY